MPFPLQVGELDLLQQEQQQHGDDNQPQVGIVEGLDLNAVTQPCGGKASCFLALACSTAAG
jgi:hypothetical protein